MAVHRMYAAMRLDEHIYTVKLTVKEYPLGRTETEEDRYKLYDLALVKEMPGDLYQRPGIKETLTGRAESIPSISKISLRTLLKDVKGMNDHPFASLQNGPNHVKYPLNRGR